MGTFFMIMKGIRGHYDKVGERAGDRGDRPGAADPGARDRAGVQAAQADDARAGLRQGDPAERARGGHGRRRRRRDRPDAGGVGRARHRRTAKVLYSPYREIIRPIVQYVRSIRDANPRGVVAVYIPEYVVGPLVGAAAAQPDRAAAQGPAAVHPRRDGDLACRTSCGRSEIGERARGAASSTGCVRGDVRRGRDRAAGRRRERRTSERRGVQPAPSRAGRAARGRRRGRSRTAGTWWPAAATAGSCLRPARAARRAGGRRGHRGREGDRFLRGRRGRRCSRRRPTGCPRRARTPARARAAAATSSTSRLPRAARR